MKKLLGIVILGLLLFLQNSNVDAHEDLEINHNAHEPITCLLEKDRKPQQKWWCKTQARIHRLCKIEQHCAILKVEELEKENKELKDKLNQ